MPRNRSGESCSGKYWRREQEKEKMEGVHCLYCVCECVMRVWLSCLS